jgi:hypothetical protein
MLPAGGVAAMSAAGAGIERDRRRRYTASGLGSLIIAAVVVVAGYAGSHAGAARQVSLLGGWAAEQQQGAPRPPQMGVHAAKRMHSLFQQQKWASMFAPRARSTGLQTDLRDAVLSSVGEPGGRYPSDEESRDASEDFERAAHARTEALSYSKFSPRSTEDNPGEFDVRQHYEIVPEREAAGITDQAGRRVWRYLQGQYRARLPSSTTYPAVPVVFSEDATGGHPSGFEGEGRDSSGRSRAGTDDGSAGTESEGGRYRGPAPQSLTRDGREVGNTAAVEKREGRGEHEKQMEATMGASQPVLKGVTSADAHAAKDSSADMGSKVEEKLTPAQALLKWERDHNVDNRAAYKSTADYRSSLAFAQSAAARELNAEPPKVALMKLSKQLGEMTEEQGTMKKHAQELEKHTKDLRAQIAAWKQADAERAKDAAANSKRISSLSKLVSGLQSNQKSGTVSEDAEKGIIGGAEQAAKARKFLEAFEKSVAHTSGQTVAHSMTSREDAMNLLAAVAGGGFKDTQTLKGGVSQHVIDQARMLLSSKVATAMAKQDEDQISADTAFIMGPVKDSEEMGGDTGEAEPFRRLHAVERTVLSKMVKDEKSAAAKRAAKARLAAKEAALKKDQAWSNQRLAAFAVKGHQKQMLHDEAVRQRALAFVNAFGKIPGVKLRDKSKHGAAL